MEDVNLLVLATQYMFWVGFGLIAFFAVKTMSTTQKLKST